MNSQIYALLSLVLNNPLSMGVVLDDGGWANIDNIIMCAKRDGINISLKEIEEVVKISNQPKFLLNDKKTKITISRIILPFD
jgi:putative RNA 2'-phosphotransferase